MNYQRQVTSVFPSPSKIPYGGFSPVRLQTEIHPPPSPPPPGLSTARIPPAVALISGQKPSHPSTAAHQRANRKGSRLTRSKRHSDRQNQAIPSRGPWLPCGLCCPAGSLLTMASCALLLSPSRLWICGWVLQPRGLPRAENKRVPNLIGVSVHACHPQDPGGPVGCTWLLLHRPC